MLSPFPLRERETEREKERERERERVKEREREREKEREGEREISGNERNTVFLNFNFLHYFRVFKIFATDNSFEYRFTGFKDFKNIF